MSSSSTCKAVLEDGHPAHVCSQQAWICPCHAPQADQHSTAAGFITKHGESKHFPLTFALPLRTDVASLPFNGVNAMKYYNGS